MCRPGYAHRVAGQPLIARSAQSARVLAALGGDLPAQIRRERGKRGPGRVGRDWLAGLVLRGIRRCTVLNQARLSRREPPERVSSGLRELHPSSPSSSKPHPFRRWIATLAREARLQRSVSTSAFWDLVRQATRSQLRWPSLGAVWPFRAGRRGTWRPPEGHYCGELGRERPGAAQRPSDPAYPVSSR